MQQAVQQAFQHLRAVLMGQHCAACAAPCVGGAVCTACAAISRAVQQRCPRCAVVQGSGALCGACITHTPLFDATLALGDFKPPLSGLISQFKFAHHMAMARWFAAQLDTLCLAVNADIVVPVPLHEQRLRERGYNQVWEIIKAMQHPAEKRHALTRLRDTPSQRSVTAAQRFSNVRGAFLADESVYGLRVLLLDDVVTTTATVQAASKALKVAGAVHITVACIARVSD